MVMNAQITTEYELLDTAEAAKVIGISPQTLRTWRHEQREGQPAFLKHPGGLVKYPRSSLDKYIADNMKSH